MGYFCKIIPMAFLLVIQSVALSWGGVIFKNNGTPGTTFKSSDLKNLTVTLTLPKKLKDYKFDQVRVILRLSHLDVDGIVYSDRVDLPANWANSNSITVNVITPDGNSDFEDSSGGSFGLKDFTTTPQSQQLQTMTATVLIKAYTKTGEKWQSYWDKMSRTWKSSSRPVYNAGTVITEGTMTVTLDKISGFSDKNGVISIELPDKSWTGKTLTRDDLPGERRQFTEIRLYRDAGGAIPVDVKLSAFAFDLNDWPELKDKGWDGLKQSVTADFTNAKSEAQFGWDRIITSESTDKDKANSPSNGAWITTTVAGQPGLKSVFIIKETYSHKAYAPLYLTVRPPYVIAAWYYFKDDYYDKRMGKDMKLSPTQNQEVVSALEQVIAKIKPLKGENTTELWIPKASESVLKSEPQNPNRPGRQPERQQRQPQEQRQEDPTKQLKGIFKGVF